MGRIGATKAVSAAELDAMVRDIRSPKLLDWFIVNMVKPALLDQIEKEMKRAPAEKQWAMNHCLAEIGIRHASLRTRAIKIGEKLRVLIDYPASPGCTPPYAPVRIAEMVRQTAKKSQKAKKAA